MSKFTASAMSGLLLFTQVALACGDRLVPVGSGVRVERITKSAHPGTVLVLSSNAANRAAETELVSGLLRTGHKAQLVTDAAQLQSALAERTPDVVLADANDLARVKATVGNAAKAPVVVLVLIRPNRDQLAEARKTNTCFAEMPGWGVSPVVKVVNNIRASQEAGRAVACAEQSGSTA